MATTLQAGTTARVLIKGFEGCERKQPNGTYLAYPDPATGGAPWTIGWGATGPDIKRGTVWTQAQCDARFERDLVKFAAEIAAMVGSVQTAAYQFDAMLSLAYNVGSANFRSSTLLKLHRAGDYAGAASQFARWNRANGQVMAGLTRRREAEALAYQGKAFSV